MKKTFCDRCGKEVPDGRCFYIKTMEYYRWRFWFSRNQQERGNEIPHEICSECQESLWQWWGSVKNNGIDSNR